nr:wiskott-Aldrich syndrome protein homolog 1-like [Aegilops tauschii subsp. strangulata]
MQRTSALTPTSFAISGATHIVPVLPSTPAALDPTATPVRPRPLLSPRARSAPCRATRTAQSPTPSSAAASCSVIGRRHDAGPLLSSLSRHSPDSLLSFAPEPRPMLTAPCAPGHPRRALCERTTTPTCVPVPPTLRSAAAPSAPLASPIPLPRCCPQPLVPRPPACVPAAAEPPAPPPSPASAARVCRPPPACPALARQHAPARRRSCYYRG